MGDPGSPAYVAAIDQGTSSTRCIVFDRDGAVVGIDQREHAQHHPRAGWVEHDANEIAVRVREVVNGALAAAGLAARDVAAVGIANQRETTVLWDRATGEPVHHAIVWQDVRTAPLVAELGGEHGEGGIDSLRAITGLPLSTYFSGPKARWLLDVDPRPARTGGGRARSCSGRSTRSSSGS